MHERYFMTINNSGSYAGLMIIEYHVSECKVFSGKLGRKFSPAFTSEHCANEILTNLLMLMGPVKQSFLFVLFHNLKRGFCAAVRCLKWFEEAQNSKMLSCFR